MVSCDVYMEAVHTGGVYIAVRVDKGGGVTRSTKGIFFWVYADGTYKVTNDLSKHLKKYTFLSSSTAVSLTRPGHVSETFV